MGLPTHTSKKRHFRPKKRFSKPPISKKTVFKTPYFGGFCPLGHFFATFLVAPREAKKCELFSEEPTYDATELQTFFLITFGTGIKIIPSENNVCAGSSKGTLPVNNGRLLAAVLAGTGLCRRHEAPFQSLSPTCPDGARTGRSNRL